MTDRTSLTATAAGTIEVGGDLTVNRLGYGAMRITGNGIWGEPPNHAEAVAVLRRAVELDINFIDTADSYGPAVSERLIAEALYPYPDDLVIATKGGLERPGPGRWTPNGRPEHLKKACEDSLQRLKLDQIPLYQFHRPDPKVPFEESVGALVELKDQGKIRHIGLSNVSEDQLRQAERLTPIVSIQNRYNVGDQTHDTLIDLCEIEQLAFLPWAPIQDLDRNSGVHQVAEQRGVTPRQVVLAWLLTRSPAVLPIPGTGSVSHLEENVAAAGLTLSPAEIADVAQGG
jgi:aryl-alcohol dehydrogenase-like predicted oxidoreductase